jgi:hypothetical protein
MEASGMKKIALSAVVGLAAVTVAMASPAAGSVEAASGQGGAAPVRRCIVIDPAAVDTNHETDRDSAKQLVPSFCP